MRITIEQINGVPHTVIYSDVLCTEENTSNWTGFTGYDLDSGAIRGYCKGGELYWTALPPLPRKPTADDEELLYRYGAHGLRPLDDDRQDKIVASHSLYGFNNKPITHAINKQGERVEVAICEKS